MIKPRETHPPATADEPITTRQTAELLGSDRHEVHRLVERRTLIPIRKLPGATGAYLFRRADVTKLARQRATDLRSQLARIESGIPQ